MRRVAIRDLLGNSILFGEFCRDLANGSVAALPTDTLYGFAADGNVPSGVDSVYSIKGRREEKPLILFLSSFEALGSLGIKPGKEAEKLLRRHWPGALTAVFSCPPGLLRAFYHPTIGIRVPKHPCLLELLGLYPGKLLTTSVNRSDSPPVSDPGEIERQFSREIGWLVDDGPLPCSEPSTVADFREFPPRILRKGKICFEKSRKDGG